MQALGSKLNNAPIVTYLLCALALVVVIAGAVVTIIRPDTLPFDKYVQDVALLTAALGLGAGIGRGVQAAGNAGTSTDTTATPPAAPVAATTHVKKPAAK